MDIEKGERMMMTMSGGEGVMMIVLKSQRWEGEGGGGHDDVCC